MSQRALLAILALAVVGLARIPAADGEDASANGRSGAESGPVLDRDTVERLFGLLKASDGACSVLGLSADPRRVRVEICVSGACGFAVLGTADACATPTANGYCPSFEDAFPDACRDGFLAAVGKLDGPKRVEGAPPGESRRPTAHTPTTLLIDLAFQGAWVFVAIACLGLAWRGRSGALDLALPVAIGLVSLLARAVLGPWGPGEIRLNLENIEFFQFDNHWGHAPIALYRMLGSGASDTAMMVLGLVLSSLVPVFLWSILRRLGFGRSAATAAALAAAAMPFLIVLSPVLERSPSQLFATFAALWLGTVFLARGGRVPAVGAILAAALATTSRPEGAIVLGLAAPMILLFPGVPARRRWGAMAALVPLGLAALGYVVGVTTSWHAQGDYGAAAPSLAALGGSILFQPEFTPPGLLGLAVGGILLGWRDRRAWMAVGVLLVLDIAWSATSVSAHFIGFRLQYASARYQTALVLPLVLGIALAVRRLDDLAPRGRAVALAILALVSAATFGPACRETFVPRAPDFEYRFIRDHVAGLPPTERVFFLPPTADAGFLDGWIVRDASGRRANWVPLTPETCAQAGAQHGDRFFEGAACAPIGSDSGRPVDPPYAAYLAACAAVRAALPPRPEVFVDVPARPYSWYAFRDPTIRLALHRLVPLPCDRVFPAPATPPEGGAALSP